MGVDPCHEHWCIPHELHQELPQMCVCVCVLSPKLKIPPESFLRHYTLPQNNGKKKPLLQFYTLLRPPQHSEKAWSSRRQTSAAEGVVNGSSHWRWWTCGADTGSLKTKQRPPASSPPPSSRHRIVVVVVVINISITMFVPMNIIIIIIIIFIITGQVLKKHWLSPKIHRFKGVV